MSTFAGSGVTGFTDGSAATSQFADPWGVAVDGSGNVYVADGGNNAIRKIDALGVVSTLAGTGVRGFADGSAATAQFAFPSGVAVDGSGNVFVADSGNRRIRKIDALGVVSTLAGSGDSGYVDGLAATAQFNSFYGVVVDGSGNVYVTGVDNRIRKVDALGVVSTLAGTGVLGFADGPAATARFSGPIGVAVDGAGNVYVGDRGNHRIRRIVFPTTQSTTTTAQPASTTTQPTSTTAQPTTTTATPTTVLPFVTFRSSIVRGPNNAAGAAVYAVTLRMTGATSGAGYEIVVSSGHVPEPVPPDPTTHRYAKTAVNGEVVWEYSLVAPRGVFRADLYPAGSPSPIASVEVK